MTDYQGPRELDPQCEVPDLDTVTHYQCGGCDTLWREGDSECCPGCGATVKELRFFDLLKEVEVQK